MAKDSLGFTGSSITRHVPARRPVPSERKLGDRPGQASALAGLGALARLAGDYLAGVASLDVAAALYGDRGDLSHQAHVLSQKGFVERMDRAAWRQSSGKRLAPIRWPFDPPRA
jgi:hypothetical protein